MNRRSAVAACTATKGRNAMIRHVTAVGFASALVLGGALVTGAVAETAKDIEGVWTLVSADNVRPDGTRIPQFGPKPTGLLVFLPNGIYSLHVAATVQANFEEGDRAQATPDAYNTFVVGQFHHRGKW